tara:strand:+ start:217 stop:456 length:240 start_codon:yes stop_codon:yes gene_type:complete
LPGVAESTVSISERQTPLWEEEPFRADKRWGNVLFPEPHSPSATLPLAQSARVIFWMMDSASSPSAPRRMTGWEAYSEE